MTATREDVRRLFGDVSDSLAANIVESGATLAELEEVAAQLAQESDVMGELERPLAGRALRLYDMLRAAEEAWDEQG